jgi:hypothetical protein
MNLVIQIQKLKCWKYLDQEAIDVKLFVEVAD